MLRITDNKVILDDNELEFDCKILEAAEYDNKVVIVFHTEETEAYDNVYCYDFNKNMIWRIKPVPISLGGTAKTSYVGVDVVENECRIVDFAGRRFSIDINDGSFLSKDIVR